MKESLGFRPQRIKALRESLGLTQEQMAEKLGKKVQQVGIWEAGVFTPSMENLLNICNTFDVAIEFFFDKVSTTVEGNAHEEQEGTE